MQPPNGVLSIYKLPFPNGSYRNGVCRALWAVFHFKSKHTYVIWRAHSWICQLPSISFPRFGFSFWVGGWHDFAIVFWGACSLGCVDKIRRQGLRQVSVEFCPVWLFQSSAQPKVRQFDMASCVQEKVVRLDVPEKKNNSKLMDYWNWSFEITLLEGVVFQSAQKLCHLERIFAGRK